MSSPATYAKIFRRPVVRVDQERTTVWLDGLYIAVIGEYTTPGIGQTPAFIATDIALLLADGAETVNLIDNYTPGFIRRVEEQAVENLARSRRYAA